MTGLSMRSLVASAVVVVLAGCPAGGGNDTANGNGTCSTDSYWTQGDQESPEMHPGMACITCHESSNEAPVLGVAGTVMGDLADENDCNGIAGVVVHITDVNGLVHDLTTNAAGNFSTGEIYATPLTIALEFEGRTSAMATAVSTGDCGTCHTVDGASGAPGRIVAP